MGLHAYSFTVVIDISLKVLQTILQYSDALLHAVKDHPERKL